ncbi:hypothetical protein CD116_11545 [Staphylococcus schweitzeri]|uniref:Uncharacterized protein n=1 Tax=Staphylococcus schweitzeri TaxID=1654388 RepID=A0A2K4AF03_9STAP|nr:hypothetical protein CD116_11545 [Staphylococcus schweitzeri]
MAEANQSIADTKLHNNAAIIANTINMTPFEVLSLVKINDNTIIGMIESIIINIVSSIDITNIHTK